MKEYIEAVRNIFGQECDLQLDERASVSPIAHAFTSVYANPFKVNFINRLTRLNKIYSRPDSNRTALFTLLKKIALKRNWTGAFAELSACDYLNMGVDQGWRPVVLNKVPTVTTLARYLGAGKEVDHDCYFDEFDVYIDVKVLADNVKELLEGIYDDLGKRLGRSDFHISEDRPLDLDPEVLKHHRAEVLEELINVFNTSKRPGVLSSKVIPQILFRFNWESGWHGSFKFYDPYIHALASHKLAFKHAKKYVERRPFLLLFLIFPWFNNVVSGFGGSNKIFYRSFSRRVFCGYMRSRTSFKTLEPAFNSNHTVRSVSKKLSGIIFLEDYSITFGDGSNKLYSAYVYLNPNADNSVAKSAFRNYMFSLPTVEYDDFEFDNY